jgi:GT2 family glycosyltransferase
MTFTLMIPTRDRWQDLEATCAKLLELRPPPLEVIICVDDCRDNTTEGLRLNFPEFKVLQNDQSKGSVYSRDRMLRAARGDVVVSLDDDSYPVDRDFLERLRVVFARHPEAAVITFPELRDGNRFSNGAKTDRSPGHYVSAYANCAAAMHRSFYLQQPGFPPFLEHMYEETDYALQCYAGGSAVWFEPTLVIRHHESTAQRSPTRRHHLNARNELWSVWLRCPWPYLVPASLYRVARQFVYACSEGARWTVREPLWWASALQGLPRCWSARRSVPWRIYWPWLTLARRPLFSLEELRKRFT